MKATWIFLAAALLLQPAYAQTASRAAAAPKQASKAATQLVTLLYPTDAALLRDVELGSSGSVSASGITGEAAAPAIAGVSGCKMTAKNAGTITSFVGRYTAPERVRLVLARYYDAQFSPTEMQQMQRFLAGSAGKKFLKLRDGLAVKAMQATQNQAATALRGNKQACGG